MVEFAAAAGAGLAFAVIGFCYSYGDRRGIDLRVVAVFLFLVGTAFFARPAGPLPARAALLAAGACAGGLANVLLMFLIRRALERGFLSSVWIAMNLAFLLPAIFCTFAYHEPISAAQKTGVLLGALCIPVLANQRKVGAAGGGRHDRRGFLSFLLLLSGLMACNAVVPLVMKVFSHITLPDGGNLYGRGAGFFLGVLYFSAFGLLASAVLFQAHLRRQWRAALLPGLAAGLGSAAGMGLISFCVARQAGAALIFTVSNVVSILLISVCSVLWFKEKAGPAWIAGNVFALACVVLFLF